MAVVVEKSARAALVSDPKNPVAGRIVDLLKLHERLVGVQTERGGFIGRGFAEVVYVEGPSSGAGTHHQQWAASGGATTLRRGAAAT